VAGLAGDRGRDEDGRVTDPYADLPYDAWMLRLLGPLRAGFRFVNRWLTIPAVDHGLGPLLGTPVTGSMLVLRTTGHRTGLARRAPLGYAVHDGRIVVCAGYGRGCHWFRNALADPEVQVALPGAVLAGRAEEITDPEDRRRAFRAVAAALGVIGRATMGDVGRADDARIDELADHFPLLAITLTGVLPGPYDPGGTFWRVPLAATAAGAALLLARRPARTAAVGVPALVAGAGVAYAKRRIDSYVDPHAARVTAAGYIEKRVRVGDVDLCYVEGPDNGAPLVLLHAQFMDWFDYSRVLPALSLRFHVYDVDYPGHGGTGTPSDYPMTADRIGADLATFLTQVVGEAAYVTGNSSGGLLAAWLAANRPELVRAVVLEDPPLFASEYPRIRRTIADRAFATSAKAVREGGVDDFLSYWIDNSSAFFARYVFPGAGRVLGWAVDEFHRARPGEPVDLGVIPNDTVRLMLRGMSRYDPRFGAAFHDGTWNRGFDHAEALSRIACPALLVQAEFSVTDDGVLAGAMTREDAERAMSLLARGSYRKVDAGHVIHLEAPQTFVELVEGFLLDLP
jgi:deazaflavin-dependent oxidoreductase (nitroreductase family)